MILSQSPNSIDREEVRLIHRRLATFALLVTPTIVMAADPVRNWQTGTLVETEKVQVPTGSTTNSNSDIDAKRKGDKTEFSRNTNSTTTTEYDNFQVYTIKADGKTVVAREKLLFPWSKPADVAVGAPIKYVIQKNTVYLMGDDGKQHKAGISKVSMDSGQ
jgi:hypothetical protein